MFRKRGTYYMSNAQCLLHAGSCIMKASRQRLLVDSHRQRQDIASDVCKSPHLLYSPIMNKLHAPDADGLLEQSHGEKGYVTYCTAPATKNCGFWARSPFRKIEYPIQLRCRRQHFLWAISAQTLLPYQRQLQLHHADNTKRTNHLV